jgi:hypothetical protein
MTGAVKSDETHASCHWVQEELLPEVDELAMYAPVPTGGRAGLFWQRRRPLWQRNVRVKEHGVLPLVFFSLTKGK